MPRKVDVGELAKELVKAMMEKGMKEITITEVAALLGVGANTASRTVAYLRLSNVLREEGGRHVLDERKASWFLKGSSELR